LPLDVIEEKHLNDIINYALDYPSMVLAHVRAPGQTGSLADIAYGLYVGYIGGVFFDGFLERNKRFLNEDEVSHFNRIIGENNKTIALKIKANLHL